MTDNDERGEQFVTDADLARFEATATPIYRSTAEAEKASKFLVSDLAQWIMRLVAEVRRLRRCLVPDPTGEIEYGFRYRDPESRWLGICPANESFARATVGSDPETWELWERTRAVPAGGWYLSGSDAEQPSRQGEPSDAAIRVALAEFYYTRPGRTQLDAMRDALRAASAVTEQGENHG